MLRYAGAVTVARAFSATSTGRRLYHRVGPRILERRRLAEGLPQRYLDRADRVLARVARHGVLAPGDRVLEVGTGWVHWEATVLALHHDVRVTMFDVRDNRLPRAYRAYLAGYRAHLRTTDPGAGRALELLDRVLRAGDLASAYAVLGLDHVVEPSGSLAGLEAGAYALATSADVLEHIAPGALPRHLDQERALLRPGGYAIHQIDLVDHYHYFDPATSPKNYYRYSDRAWRRWFESEVQYFNRIQRPQWRSLFDGSGFAVVEEDAVTGPLDDRPRAGPFARLAESDRACMQLLAVLRRPA